MTQSLGLRDRLRIERVVWSVDSRLQDLPRKSRIGKRRELRDNLRTAAMDVGVAEAIRGLGDTRQLAAGYLAAEYGDGGRGPSWMVALGAFIVMNFVLGWILEAGSNAFRDGVISSDPLASGPYTWTGVPYLLNDVTFSFVDGESTSVGGAWTPLTYVILFAVVVVAGKLWRLVPAWKHRP